MSDFWWEEEDNYDYFPPDRGEFSQEGEFYKDGEEIPDANGDYPGMFPRTEDILIIASGWDENLTNALNLFTDITEIDVDTIRGQQFQSLIEAYEWLQSTHLTGFSQIFAIPNSDVDGLLLYAVAVGDST